MSVLRSALFNLFFFVVTFLLAVLGVGVRVVAPHRALDLAMLWARVMLLALRVLCGIRFEVSGGERLAGGGAMLIASRHESAFDAMVWLSLVPRCCYVVKRELMRIPMFGPLIPLAGMIGVDRAGGAAALRGLLREGDRAVREARQIVIFPEGTRADADALLPLQPGVAALATRTGLPIIPVVTDSGRCWGRRAFHKRPGTIHIRLLEPIPAAIGREALMRRLEVALRSAPVASGCAVDNSVGQAAGDLPTCRKPQS